MRSIFGEQLQQVGWPGAAHVVRGDVLEGPAQGFLIELLDALPILCGVPAGELAPPSIAAWGEIARAALDLVVRERLVPRMRSRSRGGDDERIAGWEARWTVQLKAPAQRGLLGQLTRGLGVAQAAVPLHRLSRIEARLISVDKLGQVRGYSAPGLIRRFLDLCADTLVREASRRGAVVRLGKWPADAWEQRLVRSLGEDRAGLVPGDKDPEALSTELKGWTDDQTVSPSLLPSPPSWSAPESLQKVLGRMTGPAAFLAERLLAGQPAPRTLHPVVTAPRSKVNQSIAVTRTLLKLTAPPAGSKKQGSG